MMPVISVGFNHYMALAIQQLVKQRKYLEIIDNQGL